MITQTEPSLAATLLAVNQGAAKALVMLQSTVHKVSCVLVVRYRGLKQSRQDVLIQLIHMSPAPRNTASSVDLSIVDRMLQTIYRTSPFCTTCAMSLNGKTQPSTIHDFSPALKSPTDKATTTTLSSAMTEVNCGQRPGVGKSRNLGCRHLPTWVEDPGTGPDTNRASTRCICNMQVRGIVL